MPIKDRAMASSLVPPSAAVAVLCQPRPAAGPALRRRRRRCERHFGMERTTTADQPSGQPPRCVAEFLDVLAAGNLHRQNRRLPR